MLHLEYHLSRFLFITNICNTFHYLSDLYIVFCNLAVVKLDTL